MSWFDARTASIITIKTAYPIATGIIGDGRMMTFVVVVNGRTVTGMDDYDYCAECRLYGDDYSYDKDGDLVSNCYGCPMNPDSDAWMR